MSIVRERNYLTLAEGAIDPQARINAGEISGEAVDELAERLATDELYDDIDDQAIPCMCVDGRCGQCALGPNAAGGTFSLVVGDALTDGSYLQAGETAAQHAKRVYSELQKQNKRIGGHDDTHAEGQKSGCGAQDKLEQILAFISRKPEDIRQLIESLGVAISDELHEMILNKTNQRLNEGYATNGADLKKSFVETAGPTAVDTLQGDHGEAVLVVNTKTGKTLNRKKLIAAFGDNLQAFNLDVAGLLKGAEATSLSADEAHRKFVAALYYNVATAGVLAGPSLRVVVR